MTSFKVEVGPVSADHWAGRKRPEFSDRRRGRMETHEIRYFLAMVRELNFTRAAAACSITQPALTRAIKKLEIELGGALFLRRPGRIELTRLAREVLPRLEAIESGMSEVRTLAASVTQSQTNSIRIGVMCTVGPTHVVSILAQLQEAIPNVQISIVDATAAKIIHLLETDEVDIGITAWPSYPESVQVDPLLSERYAVAIRSDDELAQADDIPLSRLIERDYIDRLGCEFDAYYEALHGEWTLDLNIAFASEREDWIQGILLAGLGCAIVPEFMELPRTIAKRPLSEPEIVREVSLLWLRGRQLTYAASTFRRLAKAHKWKPSS